MDNPIFSRAPQQNTESFIFAPPAGSPIFKKPLPIAKKTAENQPTTSSKLAVNSFLTGSTTGTPRSIIRSLTGSLTPISTPIKNVEPSPRALIQSLTQSSPNPSYKSLDESLDSQIINETGVTEVLQQMKQYAESLEKKEKNNQQFESRLLDLMQEQAFLKKQTEESVNTLSKLLQEGQQERTQVNKVLDAIKQIKTESNAMDDEIISLRAKVQSLHDNIKFSTQNGQEMHVWNYSGLFVLFLLTLFCVFGCLLLLTSYSTPAAMNNGESSLHKQLHVITNHNDHHDRSSEDQNNKTLMDSVADAVGNLFNFMSNDEVYRYFYNVKPT